MIKYFAFALLLFSQSILAVDFEKVNCSFKSNEYLNVNESEIYEACAIDLCGEAFITPSTTITNHNIRDVLSKHGLSNLKQTEDKVRSVIENSIKRRNRFFDAFSKANKQELDLSTWNDDELRYFSKIYFDRFVKFNFDKEVEFEIDEFKKDNQAFIDYANNKKNKIKKSVNKLLKYGLLTEEKLKAFLLENIEKIKGFSRKDLLEKAFPGVLNNLSKDLENIDKFPKKELTNLVRNTNFILEKIKLKKKEKEFYVCKTDSCLKELKNFLEKAFLKNTHFQMSSLTNSESFIDSQVALCMGDYAVENLKEYNDNELKKHIPIVLDNYKNKIVSNYSEDTQKEWDLYVKNKLKFALLSKANYLNKRAPFVKRLNKEVKLVTDSASKSVDYTRYDKNTLSRFLVNMAIGKPLPYTGKLGCKGHTTNWDEFSNFARKGINLKKEEVSKDFNYVYGSFHSNVHPEYGHGVLAHEIGHALNMFAYTKLISFESVQTYLKQRKCSNYSKKLNQKGKRFFKSDSNNTEEDMADYLGFITSSSKELYTCSLLSRTKDGLRYLGLSTDQSTEAHSAALIRLLNEALYKEKILSKSCQKIVDDLKEVYNFGACK